MARRTGRKPARRHSEVPEASDSQEFSLEQILSEYRLSVREPESSRESAPSGERLTMEPEPDGILSARIREDPPPEAETPEEAPWEQWSEEEPTAESREAADGGSPEEVLDEIYAPEELRPWQEPEEAESTAPVRRRSASPTSEAAAEGPAEQPEREEPTPEEPVTEEGFDDDADFYAGTVEAPAETSQESGEESADSTSSGHARPVGRGGSGSGALNGLWKKLSSLLAMASYKREQRRRQAPPEPENSDKEMAPDKAARYYSSQMPALRLRSYGALGVCLLLCWITLGSGLGGGLPGSLATDVRLAAMVLLVGQITVMLLALDIVTAGIMSLLRGRPGAESLLLAASLASVMDTIAIIVSKNDFRGIPFGAVCSLGLFFALRGSWHFAGGYHDSFLALFHSQKPVTLSQEELPERKDKVLLASRRETKGFIRRSEEPGEAELLASTAFFPLLLGSGALSLAIGIGSGDLGAFFHVFALMTALCAGFGWLFSYPYLFSRIARHLMVRGSALAGWSGARDMGSSRRLVIRDTDVFPEDTMEITGIRLLDKSKARHIIACTGTMLSTAGTGSAKVFAELMRRHKAAMQSVEEFSVGEGGCKGTIQYQEVRVGSLGYMYLSGVKVPDKLKAENAVYTAIGGDLSGVFLFRYRPMGSVQRSLKTLRTQHRKPLIIARDFNIDPLLIREAFGVSTEGFEFPPFPERYQLSSALGEGKAPVAGLTAADSLDLLVDLSESGAQLYTLGRICAWAALGSAVLGMALMLVPCWLGNWAAASAWRVMVYALVWLLPALIGRLLLRK